MTKPYPTTLADFDDLNDAEEKVIAAAREGRWARLGLTAPEKGAEGPTVRASLIRYLALGGCEDCVVHPKGLRVRGAVIRSDGPEWAETRGAGPRRLHPAA